MMSKMLVKSEDLPKIVSGLLQEGVVFSVEPKGDMYEITLTGY